MSKERPLSKAAQKLVEDNHDLIEEYADIIRIYLGDTCDIEDGYGTAALFLCEAARGYMDMTDAWRKLMDFKHFARRYLHSSVSSFVFHKEDDDAVYLSDIGESGYCRHRFEDRIECRDMISRSLDRMNERERDILTDLYINGYNVGEVQDRYEVTKSGITKCVNEFKRIFTEISEEGE